jgi:hypothetical protein
LMHRATQIDRDVPGSFPATSSASRIMPRIGVFLSNAYLAEPFGTTHSVA